jgi:hypothetical protein
MIDEDKLSQDRAKALRAQSLLENELLIEAYAKLEAELVSAWIATPLRDTDGRERCWAAVQANRKHKDYLQQIVTNGKFAADQLKALADNAERSKRFRII